MSDAGKIKIEGFERVLAHGEVPDYYAIKFHIWVPGEANGTRSNLTGGIRLEMPWPETPEAFDDAAKNAVKRFIRQIADQLESGQE